MIDVLIDIACAYGIHIDWHRGGPKGVWFPDTSTISLRNGMTDTQTLCTLAHELGHAHYFDPPGCLPEYEERADKFGASMLISTHDYAQAEKIYGPHPQLIANELGVTAHMVHIWRGDFESRKFSA